MFQIVPKLSLIKAKEEFADVVNKITLRGYINKPPVSITGGFKWALEENKIKALSVNEITNIFCPTRRDIYMNKVLGERGKPTWGRITGDIVDSYICGATDKYKRDSGISKTKRYSSIKRKSIRYTRDFSTQNERLIDKLANYKRFPNEDKNLLINTLDYALRHEFLMLRLSKILSDGFKKIDIQNIEIKPQIKPNPKILGISSPATPDFLITNIMAIGDIKTGTEFKDYFRLAAAGYALTYENQFGKGNDINLGLIYFFPTRQRDISFAHLYIFVIDDALRSEFLSARDRALMVMRDYQNPPPFIDRDKYCIYCKYSEECDKLRKRKKK
jgi:CRISPR/Cas system-associated exonuclease Cas4 (RecB family)